MVKYWFRFGDQLYFHWWSSIPYQPENNNGSIKKRGEAIVEIPTTKAQTTTVLGAISTFGIISVNVRLPYEFLSNKSYQAHPKCLLLKQSKLQILSPAIILISSKVRLMFWISMSNLKFSTSSWIMFQFTNMKISQDTLSIKYMTVYISPPSYLVFSRIEPDWTFLVGC